jgi:hypothetical protein
MEAWEPGHGVTQWFVGLMSDDESFDGLAWPGKVGADIADVTSHLADGPFSRGKYSAICAL